MPAFRSARYTGHVQKRAGTSALTNKTKASGIGTDSNASGVLKYNKSGTVVSVLDNGGPGGTVTQITSRSTGVTLNAMNGAITMDATSLAAGAEAQFTVTNSFVAAGDVVVCCLKTTGTGTPFAAVTTVAAGSFQITLTNLHAATADTTADVISFMVLKTA